MTATGVMIVGLNPCRLDGARQVLAYGQGTLRISVPPGPPQSRHRPMGQCLLVRAKASAIMGELLQLKLYMLRFILVAGMGYTRNCLANIIKKIIGMNIYFNPSELFLRDYIRSLLGLGSRPRITTPALHRLGPDGAGAQARLVMCAINFARTFNLPYVHTPFCEISHADRPMQLWVKAWNEEFNLGAGEISAECSHNDCVDFLGDLGSFVSCFGFRNLHAVFNITSKEFRKKYYLNKAPKLNSSLIVAIHMRRGDAVTHWSHVKDTYVTVRKIIDVMDTMTLTYNIQLFSEGSVSEFSELEPLGVKLYLNADAIWTMRELIEADILVMAKSCFSYVAAIISDGIKIYEPFVSCPPLKDWLVRQPEGDFDEHLFKDKLEAMIHSRNAWNGVTPGTQVCSQSSEICPRAMTNPAP
jgi:hypothetical protein